MKKLSALICGVALLALPVLAQENPQTGIQANAAGTHTITTSGSTRTMTNTEGNKVMTVSHTKGQKATHTMTHTKHVKHAKVKTTAHVRHGVSVTKTTTSNY